MRINGLKLVKAFGTQCPTAKKPLQHWDKLTQAASWHNLMEIRESGNSTDYKSGYYIFDIKDNDFQLLSRINFTAQTVLVSHVLTHKEYDKLKL